MAKNTLKRIIYISIVIALLVCLVITLLWQMQSNISFFVTPSQFSNLLNCQNEAQNISPNQNCTNNANTVNANTVNAATNANKKGMQNIRVGGLVSNISPCDNNQIELIKTAVSQSHISKSYINYGLCKTVTLKDDDAEVNVFFCGTMPMLMQVGKGAVLKTSYICVNNINSTNNGNNINAINSNSGYNANSANSHNSHNSHSGNSGNSGKTNNANNANKPNNNCFLIANEALAKHDENYSPPTSS